MAKRRSKSGRAATPLSLRSTLKGHADVILRLSWAPRGDLLASCSVDRTVRIWDLATGAVLRTLTGHSEGINQAAWSPDREMIATASFDRTIKIWDVQSGGLLRTLLGHEDDVPGLDWSPDGALLASASMDRTVRLWDPHTGSELRKVGLAHRGGTFRVRWSPRDGRLATCGGDRTIHVWDATLAPVSSLKGHTGAVIDITWSPDGTILASASRDDSVGIWRLDGAPPAATHLDRQLMGHTDDVRGVSFSHDGRLLASNSMDGRVCLWRTDTWTNATELEEPPSSFWPPNLAFHPEKAILATLGGRDRDVRVWDVDIDAAVGTPRGAAPDPYYCNAKVVLVGESGRGKTALGQALLGRPYEDVAGSTHGMKVWKFDEETVDQPGSGALIRETQLWDLAGQADYQVVHHLFLDETAVGIVVFDPSDRESPFKGVPRWDKALRQVAGETCPRLLVAGRVDVGPPVASAQEIGAIVEQCGFREFLQTSAKTGRGVPELREAIRRAIPWDRLPKVTSPKLWQDIRDYLVRRRAGGDVLLTVQDLRDGFRREHPGTSVPDDAFDAVLRNAQAQGLIWRLSFGGFVLLRPDLLNSYAASVVLAARRDPGELGCVPERDVKEARVELTGFDRIPDPEAEKALLHAVVELFLKREVALREGPMLVFPSRLTRPRPGAGPVGEVAYRFEGAVEDIYATLVVRLSYSGLFQRKEVWKDAAEFLSLNGAICRFAFEGPEEGLGRISVSFAPSASQETRLTFLKFIQDHLQARALSGSVRRERLYLCPNPVCGKELKDREAIAHLLAAGKKTVRCLYCDTAISLDDPLERLFEDPKLVGRVGEANQHVAEVRDREVKITVSDNKATFREFDVFLAHNSVDKPSVLRVAEELRRRGLSPWLDEEQIRPGLWYQEVIQQGIKNVKTAAIFLGASGLGRWQTAELHTFHALCVENNVPVIPVLLPGVESIPADLLFLRQLNQVAFKADLGEAAALDNLEWGITGKHPKRSRERPAAG